MLNDRYGFVNERGNDSGPRGDPRGPLRRSVWSGVLSARHDRRAPRFTRKFLMIGLIAVRDDECGGSHDARIVRLIHSVSTVCVIVLEVGAK